MRVFFGSTFMNKECLKEAGINHPIKLEYYKVINEDEINKLNRTKFGINIVKTEYKKDNIKTENKLIKHLSNDEIEINQILDAFKENQVTPIIVEDILQDFSKKSCFYNNKII